MNAKRKILIAVVAAIVVLAGGAFAWKTGKGPSTATNGASASTARPLELRSEEHTSELQSLV